MSDLRADMGTLARASGSTAALLGARAALQLAYRHLAAAGDLETLERALARLGAMLEAPGGGQLERLSGRVVRDAEASIRDARVRTEAQATARDPHRYNVATLPLRAAHNALELAAYALGDTELE